MKNGALFDTLRCLLWSTVNLIMSEYWTSMTVSEFNLSFKASLRATSLLWISFILELELTSITTISYLDSHFERETKGNSEIVYLLGPFGNTSCNTLSKVNLSLCRKPGLYHHPPLRFFLCSSISIKLKDISSAWYSGFPPLSISTPCDLRWHPPVVLGSVIKPHRTG